MNWLARLKTKKAPAAPAIAPLPAPEWQAPEPTHTPLAPDPGKANLLALVIALCDRTGVSDKARTQWLQDAEDTPAELRGDLYQHLLAQLPPAPIELPRSPTVHTGQRAAASNDAATPASLPELPDWRTLDKAYLAHHTHCHICQAAGRGARYGLRCGVGAALWTAYDAAANTPGVLPWQQKGQRHE